MKRLIVILALGMKASAVSAADASFAFPTGDVYEVEFRFKADVLAKDVPEDSQGIASLSPATLASGDAGFLAWGGGVWHEVFADGIVPSTNDWTQAKFSVRIVDGEKLVSYLVMSGNDYVRLRTASGQGWFRTSPAALVPDVTFDGPGEGEVVGSLSEDLEAIKDIADDSKGRIEVKHNVCDMKSLMVSSDLAVSAAGSTLYELCACGVPTINYILADNQKLVSESFRDKGVMLSAGDVRDNPLFYENLYSMINDLSKDEKKRRELSERAHCLIDGNGAARLAEAIISNK